MACRAHLDRAHEAGVIMTHTGEGLELNEVVLLQHPVQIAAMQMVGAFA